MVEALERPAKESPPLLLGAYAVGFSLVHCVASASGWYYAYPWLDIVTHVGGGVLVAWVFLAVRRRLPGVTGLPLLWQAILVLGLVALVGVLWELLEGIVDSWVILSSGVPLKGLPDAFAAYPYDRRWDTILDLFDDLVGGTAVALIWLGLAARRSRIDR